MTVRIPCPNCGVKLKAKDQHLGRQATCPSCKHRFTLSLPEEPPSGSISRHSEQESSLNVTPPPVPSEVPSFSTRSGTMSTPSTSSREEAEVYELQDETYGLREEPVSDSLPLGLAVEESQAAPAWQPRKPRSSSGKEPPGESASLGTVRRPLPVVLIVFYWVLCWGIPLLGIGAAVSTLTELFDRVRVLAAVAQLLGPLGEEAGIGPPDGARKLSLIAEIGAEVLSFTGFLIAAYAVFVFATCYGFWSSQPWANACGQVISIGNLIMVIIQLLLALLTGLLSILVSLAHLAICVCIALYLLGLLPSVHLFHRHMNQIRTRRLARW